MKLTTPSSLNLLFEISMQILEQNFLPVQPQGGLSFLFRLSAPRFA